MKVTYLGTASVLLEYGGQRILTDPAFDAEGTNYKLAPWYVPKAWFNSTRQYSSPLSIDELGAIDIVLISHDHHPDNLDTAGRALVEGPSIAAVITNPAAAKRLSKKRRGVTGLTPGESTTLGEVTITSTPARHGPKGTPQVDEVTGFLLEAKGEPRLWISGDTVLSSELRDAAPTLKPDVAIIHAGGVRFPKAPGGLGKALFTFDAAQVVEIAALVQPKLILPVHRSGWTHFQQESVLREALDTARLSERTRFLALGETTSA